jgi:hypothetical protein
LENADRRPALEIGNSVLQIGAIFCSSGLTLMPTGGNDGTIFSIRKLQGVATLSGCGRSSILTRLRRDSPIDREITGKIGKSAHVLAGWGQIGLQFCGFGSIFGVVGIKEACLGLQGSFSREQGWKSGGSQGLCPWG